MMDIVMSTWNGALYIEEMLTSILKQSYQEWTLWIRDDGSFDDTMEKIKHFADIVNNNDNGSIKKTRLHYR